jgi:3'(2'), 5'-bisphosphate nucleotidase
MDDHELAAWLAEEAGRILLGLRGGALESHSLGYVADQTANAFLLSSLRMLRPEDAILSEESPDNRARLAARRVWIVDPLDGTREYAEQRSDWAVHVALATDGLPAAGAVSQPALERTCSSPSARRASPPCRAPVLLVSRSRRPEGAAALAEALGADLQEMGSAGAKTMAVIAGEADLYFHTGGQHQWDNCAPVAVALAAGLTACRIDGSQIRYNQEDLKVPDLLIAEPAIGRRALEAIRELRL